MMLFNQIGFRMSRLFCDIFHIFFKIPLKGLVEAISGMKTGQIFFGKIDLCREKSLIACLLVSHGRFM